MNAVPRAVRGVALLTALLVVAIATVVLSLVLDQAQSTLARTRNLMRGAQADQYALGLEDWAVDVLRRDHADGAGIDTNEDMWAMPLPPTQVPGGRVFGRMQDQNGRFDLNSLVSPTTGAADPVAVERFRRLLTALQLDPALADAVVDWIDPDFEPLARGGEDNLYLASTPARRVANRRLSHVSELIHVRGFDAVRYATLLPHVCALPRPSPLNVNTATLPVLMSLDPGITSSAAQRLAREGRARYASVNEFSEEVLRQGGQLASQAGLGVASEYFAANADLELDGIPFHYGFLIERTAQGRLAVLQRMRGEW